MVNRVYRLAGLARHAAKAVGTQSMAAGSQACNFAPIQVCNMTVVLRTSQGDSFEPSDDIDVATALCHLIRNILPSFYCHNAFHVEHSVEVVTAV